MIGSALTARRARVAAMALGAALAAFNFGAGAQTIDQIYEAAKAEKSLALWGAGPTAGYETAVFYTIVRKYGWSYMDHYMAQQPKFIQGHLGVARSLGAGESLVTFDNTTGSTNTVKREGGKIELTAPVSDRLPMFFTSEAILKDAPHPNAAKLYVSWFLSKEQQSRIGVYSSRGDVPPPAGMMPLSGYHLANDYLKFVTNEKRLVALRQRFEKYTGPVANAGGVK